MASPRLATARPHRRPTQHRLTASLTGRTLQEAVSG
jgi:hypothetical protein